MTGREFVELAIALQGTNPRPQPWQTEMVGRLVDRTIERSRRGRNAGLPLLLSTNWGAGDNWLFKEWGKAPFSDMVEARPPAPRLFGAWDAGRGRDRVGVLVHKPRSVGCSWARSAVSIVALDVPPPSAETLSHAQLILGVAMGERIDREARRRAMGTEFERANVLKLATVDDFDPSKKNREPFYAKFTPKRRLT